MGTRWRWVVSFMPSPLYPLGKIPQYPLNGRLGGPQSQTRRGTGECFDGAEFRTLAHPTCSLVRVLAQVSWLRITVLWKIRMLHVQFVNYDAWNRFDSFKHVMTFESSQAVQWHLYVKSEQNVIFNIVFYCMTFHMSHLCHGWSTVQLKCLLWAGVFRLGWIGYIFNRALLSSSFVKFITAAWSSIHISKLQTVNYGMTCWL